MTISSAVQECLKLFLACQDAPRIRDSLELRLEAQNEYDRFRLWVGNVAAHRPPSSHRSLEHRLRQTENLKQTVIELLQELRKVLLDIVESPSDDCDMTDVEDGLPEFDVDDLSDADETFGNVRYYVGLLYRFSVTLRTPVSRYRIHRRFEKSQSPFYGHYLAHVKDKFLPVKDEVATRLAHVMASRRQVLTYNKDHHSKMSEELYEDDTGAQLSSTVATALNQSYDDNETTAEHDGLDDIMSQGTTTSFALTESDTSKLFPPPLPTAGQDGEPFECPICFSMVSFAIPSSWRRHVFEDIMPYVCTVSGCATPHRKYPHRREWQKHERQQHFARWHCPFEANAKFDSPQSFEDHLRTEHLANLTEQAVEDLTRACVRNDDRIDVQICPLCERHCSSASDWYRHVGHHHEQLALFCLDSHLLGDEEEKIELHNDHSRNSSDSSIEDISVTTQSPIPKSSRENSLLGSHVETRPCHLCDETFWSLREVRQHNEETHNRFQHCTVSGCGWSFETEKDLQRHLLSKHGQSDRLVCPITTCDYHIRGFKEDSDLRRHLEFDHGGGTTVLDRLARQAGHLITTSTSNAPVAQRSQPNTEEQGPYVRRIEEGRIRERSTWVRDRVPCYRLRMAELRHWLHEKFGSEIAAQADVRLYQDSYIFRVPRLLTDDERDEIMDMRVDD